MHDIGQSFLLRRHLCGYDLNLTYPQNGHFPALNPPFPDYPVSRFANRRAKHTLVKQALQNGKFDQGFTRPPSTPWFDDSGEFAGIVHQERNWT